jgi:hypothetical protein
MPVITTSTGFRTLKKTLDNIITDDSDGAGKNLVCTQYMMQESMDDYYVDDLENGGPGLLTEKGEAQPVDVLSLDDGAMTRYISKKLSGALEISAEMDDDGKYNGKYIDAARRLKRAGFKTLEYDCSNVLIRATNTGYVGGDGQPLASASHTLPGGGTFSNTLSVAFSPSMAALTVVRNNVAQLPGHDGLTEGYTLKKVVFPSAQWGAWESILGSSNAPGTANNDINVVRKLNITPVEVPFWDRGSTTNWLVLTSADNGLKLKWKQKFKSRTFYDERPDVIVHAISGRWARLWSDARHVYFSNA